MKNKRSVAALGLVIVALALLACDASSLVALVVNPTETPTRTPRPTFTPRPSDTPTPEATATPEATRTPEASPTPTRRAVVATPRPVATKPPAAPPPPALPWHQSPNLGIQGLCPAGPGTFEVKGRIQQNGEYTGGIHIVLLDSTGKVINQMDSIYKEQMNLEFHVNCREDKNLFNYQLDASAGRMNQPMTLHITKSATDLTPISPDVKLDFPPDGGRYYIDWVNP